MNPEIETRKLSDLRPCDNCGQKIVPVWNVIEIRFATVNPEEANRTLGLAQMLGSGAVRSDSLAIAEVMGDSSECVKISKAPHDELFLCMTCLYGDLNIGEIMERKAAS